MRTVLRNIKSLLFFPLVLIPIGMVCYALGTILLSPTIIGTSIFVDKWYLFPRILRSIGNLVQSQTGLLVAVSITLGLANKSLRAILSTMFVYFFMQVSFEAIMSMMLSKELYQEFSNMPLTIYPFYLIGGIIIAVIVSRLHASNEQKNMLEKLENIKQKIWQSFLSVFFGMIGAIILAILWCYVIRGISLLQTYFTGVVGSGILGFLETLLRPFGITTLFESMQNFTYIGGTWRVPSPINTNVYGFEAIWLNQLQYASGKFTVGTMTAVRYINGIFVTPAIGLALINTAYIEHRKNVSIILIAFMIISAIVGFTLPIEIILLFTAPLLYVVNAVLYGVISGFIAFLSTFININLITVSGGGILDFVFFGIIPGVEKTGAWVLILIGLFNGLIAYYLFYFIIKKFNLPVFGRNKQELEIFTSYMMNTPASIGNEVSTENKIKTIIYALGGKENIKFIDVSMYRLHIAVKNIDIIETLPIKESGAAGVFIVGETVQVIFGAVTQDYYKKIMSALDV